MIKTTIPLWEHQINLRNFAVDSMRTNGFCWWIAGCAVGKTLSALSVAEQFGSDKTLVLTKKTIINQAWGGTLGRHTEGATYLPLTEGTSGDKLAKLLHNRRTKSLVCVVNYETASILAAELGDFGFDLVIADESHKLKSHNSKQSMNLALALSSVPYKIAMTGTPFDDRPTDAFGQVRFLDGGRRKGRSVASKLLGSWTTFFEKYVIYRQLDNIKIPLSYKNMGELQQIINPFTMYLNSEEALDLPIEQDIDYTVEWTTALKRVYEDMRKEALATHNGADMTADNALVQSLRLHQLTGGYFAGDKNGSGVFIDTPKIDATLDILDEIGGKPTVIFTVFETDVQGLKPRLEAAGYKVKLLVGGTYQHEEFQKGDGDVIVVNLSAGNAGIELTRARYAIYYSVGLSRTDYQQSRYRLRRPGSDLDYPVTYYKLILPSSVDKVLHHAMTAKGKMSDLLLQGLVNRAI